MQRLLTLILIKRRLVGKRRDVAICVEVLNMRLRIGKRTVPDYELIARTLDVSEAYARQLHHRVGEDLARLTDELLELNPWIAALLRPE